MTPPAPTLMCARHFARLSTCAHLLTRGGCRTQDNFSSLKCRSTPLEYIRRQEPSSGLASPPSNSLSLPPSFPVPNLNLLPYDHFELVGNLSLWCCACAAGFPLFESESLRYPGFVEFDDVNSKVLTYSAAGLCPSVLSSYLLYPCFHGTCSCMGLCMMACLPCVRLSMPALDNTRKRFASQRTVQPLC